MAETDTSRQEPAHDVLAAEAFAMPAPDPELHYHGPIVLPDDPTGVSEPHDILAAEEFPMPAPRPGVSASLAQRAGSSWRLAVALIALSAIALAVLRRRRP